MLTCLLTVKTNQWFVFANGTKLHGVQFKQLQTLGVYFAIYPKTKLNQKIDISVIKANLLVHN